MLCRVSDFEDRLRAIAKDISGAVERNIDEVAETLGVDGERARHFAEAAGQWINDHVEGGEELFGRQPADPPPPSQHGKPGRPGKPPLIEDEARTSRPGPHPLDLPTAAQGLALSALDSGRWTVRPGSNMLASTGEGPAPVDAAELVSELRGRDWIKADGELTLVGRRALGRWCDTAELVTAPATAASPPAGGPASAAPPSAGGPASAGPPPAEPS
jgi:hypothetical protein